jgi:hypothetical protein
MLDEKPLSHEERFALMSKRIRTAYKANLGLQLSPTEIQMLGMTSLIGMIKPTTRAPSRGRIFMMLLRLVAIGYFSIALYGVLRSDYSNLS